MSGALGAGFTAVGLRGQLGGKRIRGSGSAEGAGQGIRPSPSGIERAGEVVEGDEEMIAIESDARGLRLIGEARRAIDQRGVEVVAAAGDRQGKRHRLAVGYRNTVPRAADRRCRGRLGEGSN